MPKTKGSATWLLLSLGLSGCALPPCAPEPPIQVPAPRLQPPPPEVMVPRQANFRQRLLDAFSSSPTTPTPPPISSQPAKP